MAPLPKTSDTTVFDLQIKHNIPHHSLDHWIDMIRILHWWLPVQTYVVYCCTHAADFFSPVRDSGSDADEFIHLQLLFLFYFPVVEGYLGLRDLTCARPRACTRAHTHTHTHTRARARRRPPIQKSLYAIYSVFSHQTTFRIHDTIVRSCRRI